MKRAVIDGSGQVVNVVVLPADWTGAGGGGMCRVYTWGVA